MTITTQNSVYTVSNGNLHRDGVTIGHNVTVQGLSMNPTMLYQGAPKVGDMAYFEYDEGITRTSEVTEVVQ